MILMDLGLYHLFSNDQQNFHREEPIVTIYILGMGAVGSLFASVLHSNGQKVVGLCRGKHFDAIQSYGLTYVNLQGDEKVISVGENFEVHRNLRSPNCKFANLDSNDWIFISSKVYGLESLIVQYSDIIEKHGSIVLVQNGLGNEDLVFKKLPNLRVYRILTTNGALLESPGNVRHTGPGYTKIGFPQSNPLSMEESKVKSLIVCFRKSPLSLELDTHIDVLLWEKIFVNIGINAIASIYNIPNGGLIETQERKDLMRDAITEAWKVAKAMNISVDETPNRYIEFTYSVCAKTKPNRNSMLQDLDKGRKTEVDFINKIIVNYGEKLGVATPINQELTRKIKKLEK